MTANTSGFQNYFKVEPIKCYQEKQSSTQKALDNVFDFHFTQKKKEFEENKEASESSTQDSDIKKLDTVYWINDFKIIEAINNSEFTSRIEGISRIAALKTYKN